MSITKTIPSMPKCSICDADGFIFDHEKWYCSQHADENKITERQLKFGLDGKLSK